MLNKFLSNLLHVGKHWSTHTQGAEISQLWTDLVKGNLFSFPQGQRWLHWVGQLVVWAAVLDLQGMDRFQYRLLTQKKDFNIGLVG